MSALGKDELMSTTPRLPSAVPGARANIATVRRHSAAVMDAFDAMYASLLGGGVAGMDVKEAMRLRNAAASGCRL
jgi:hypothetical protein